MKKEDKKFASIFIRYFLLVLLAIPNFWIFYFVFTPLTVYASYFLLNLFFNATLSGDVIYTSKVTIEIIAACVAGAAYYFLTILNLSTPNLTLKKRLTILFESFIIFYIVNVLRIFLLAIMFLVGSPFFEFSHKLFWYLGSTLFVVIIWFVEVKHFRIKSIPFYSDLKLIVSKIKKKKKK